MCRCTVLGWWWSRRSKSYVVYYWWWEVISAAYITVIASLQSCWHVLFIRWWVLLRGLQWQVKSWTVLVSCAKNSDALLDFHSPYVTLLDTTGHPSNCEWYRVGPVKKLTDRLLCSCWKVTSNHWNFCKMYDLHKKCHLQIPTKCITIILCQKVHRVLPIFLVWQNC